MSHSNDHPNFRRVLAALVTAVFGAAAFARGVFAQPSRIVLTEPAQKNADTSGNWIGFFIAVVAIGLLVWLVFRVMKIRAHERPGARTRVYRRSGRREKPRFDESKTRTRVKTQLEKLIEMAATDPRYLPIFSLSSIPEPPTEEALPASDDDALAEALRASNVDIEPNDERRAEALQVLAANRTQESIDALSQMAVYDLSSGLRSQALLALADHDHPSGFEAILLARADPTREVRAAASRALARITYSRSDAWFRMANSDDPYHLQLCARAVMAADQPRSIFARLVDRRRESVLEAFAIVCLLLRGGETKAVFDSICNPAHPNIARALLHVIRMVNDDSVYAQLVAVLADTEVDVEILDDLEQMMESYEISVAFSPGQPGTARSVTVR